MIFEEYFDRKITLLPLFNVLEHISDIYIPRILCYHTEQKV